MWHFKYIFNPEHDLCLANGDPNFVPPDSALTFGRDCAGLTHWIGAGKGEQIVPWGWDKVLRKRLLKEGTCPSLLPSDIDLNNIREFSHRRTAAEALSYITEAVPAPVELCQIDDIAHTCAQYRDAILKAPWSGSGKGLRWVHEKLSESDEGWCRRIISRQGSVMVERRYDVVTEFAMLFHCDSSTVNFEGYSLFHTDNGIYHSNLLASDSEILRHLGQYISTDDLTGIEARLTDFLHSRFVGRYQGFLGVDMFICRQSSDSAGQHQQHLPLSNEEPSSKDASTYFIHPCVEINVRMTMGLLARRIYDYHLPQLLRDSPFEMPFCDGRYVMSVLYSPDATLSIPQNAIPLSPMLPTAHYAVILSPEEASEHSTCE